MSILFKAPLAYATFFMLKPQGKVLKHEFVLKF